MPSAHPSLRLHRGILYQILIGAMLLFTSGVGSTTPVYAQSLIFSSGGGALSLTITTATPGSEPDDVSNNSSEITWDSDFGTTSKMTVSTFCPTQAFRLFVTFTVTSWGSGTSGTETGEVELVDGMPDTDIFRDIPAILPGRSGFATLIYRASATVSDGNSAEHGDDFHTVTYTLLAQ